ncbi:MAG: aminotransferase class IV [Planctomycetota bacterium]|nr:aminotransferase class IV [Planctomycetota bacterium]MDA1114126.1 aminotransferase class IV [Planctomycetota bacterium]
MKPVQDPTQILMLDGCLASTELPSLFAGWPGVLRGEGIFETFLVRGGVPSPMLPQHDARLTHSANLTGFEVPLRTLTAQYQDFSQHLERGNWRVRLTVLRGLEEQQHFLWTAGPEPAPRESVILQISEHRLDPLDPIAGAKTVSRIGLQVARKKAHDLGAYDAILRTVDGDLAEGTSTNLFLWMDDALHTPGLDRGILGGVTRQTVLKACRAADIPVFERRIELTELSSAVEVYITNAVIGLTPVACILQWRDQLPGPSGPALQRIREAYVAYISSITQI